MRRDRPSPSAQQKGTVFLVNPASGNGSTRRRWPEIAHRAGIAGLTGETWMSTRAGEIADLAARAAGEGVDLIVVVGGDGTLNEAVNGLLREPRERLPELAVLASGTGQDFVRTYGIPTKVEEAARVALEGKARQIDAGRVEYATWEGGRATAWFANVASAGMSGAVAQRANATSKALGGRVSFFWALVAVFARWQNTEVVVTLDAGEERRGALHDVIVANGQWHGGGMWLAPEAKPDDGVFDVLLIGDVTQGGLHPHGAEALQG